jgi:hypothetical protein
MLSRLQGATSLRQTIAIAFGSDSPPFVDDSDDDDRRRVSAPGFVPRPPGLGRRKSKRSRVILGALIVSLDLKTVIACRIENVSDGGAGIKLAERRFIPSEFWLVAITAGLAYRSSVAWREDNHIGVEAPYAPRDLNDARSTVEHRLRRLWLGWRI